MITKTGYLLKYGSLTDKADAMFFRLLKSTGRGAYSTAKLLGRGAVHLGRLGAKGGEATVKGVQRLGDFAAKKPLRTLAVGGMLVASGMELPQRVSKSWNNVVPHYRYMD